MARTPVESADHLVVGAGAAGCVLAARLSEDPSKQVVLLEAGPRSRKLEIRIPAAFNKLFHSALDWDYATAPEPSLDDRELYWPRGKAVGGSTVMNAQMWVRGSRADYDAWAAAGCEGWGWDDVAETFRTIERCGRGPAAWRGTDGPLQINELRSPNPMTHAFLEAAMAAGIPRTHDVNDPANHEGVDFTQVCQKGGRRHSVADAYLGAARRRPNLTVLTGARATEVLMQDGRATGVRYLRDRVASTMWAGSEVFLCGGSVNTPHLLMRSGIGPADHLSEHGIECQVDLAGVGSNLQDHLFVAVITLSAEGVGGSLLTAESKRNLASWVFRGRGMLSSNVGEALAMVRTDPALPAADIELIFAPVPFIDHGLTVPPGHGVTVGAVLLQPESRGTIRLGSSDPLAPPVISPGYLSDPGGKDLATLTAGARLAQQVMSEKALAAYVDRPLEPAEVPTDDEGWHRFIREQAETLYHPVGTARMGPADDPASVVDPQLRVLGVDGLRVVDASVMPTINRGHTQAPTMLIAERAAAMVGAGS
jgi:choline dehydrogenase